MAGWYHEMCSDTDTNHSGIDPAVETGTANLCFLPLDCSAAFGRKLRSRPLLGPVVSAASCCLALLTTLVVCKPKTAKQVTPALVVIARFFLSPKARHCCLKHVDKKGSENCWPSSSSCWESWDVRKGNAFGTQFHPKRSGDAGLALLDKWLHTPDIAKATTATVPRIARAPNPKDGLTNCIIGNQCDVREKDPTGAARNLCTLVALTARYYAAGADELCPLNQSSRPSAKPMLAVVRAAVGRLFVPLTIGGAQATGTTRLASAPRRFLLCRTGRAIEMIAHAYRVHVVSIDSHRVILDADYTGPYAVRGANGSAWW
ncbi:hypothetical protein B0H11DRAFT_1901170 [Mycena galericulata]|nr:hypothetical protein B0H11DRAFT_1901170 [Mycena galericulata]